jgi:hypothetical protein
MWVVQETVVATKARVYYGIISAPWAMLARAAMSYEKDRLTTSVESVYPYLQPLTQFARIITEIEGTRRNFEDNSRLTTLLPLLRLFRSRKSTDPRDKVFALLGLVQYWGQQADKILPNYDTHVDWIFWKTATTLIKNTSSLDVLLGTLGPRVAPRMGRGRPSWVTDWAHPPDIYESVRLNNTRLYDAAKNDVPGPVTVHGQSILELHAYQIDEVAFVASELPLAEDGDPRRWRAVVSEWEHSLERLGMTGAYSGGGTVASAFWRTLCGDIEHHRDRLSGQTAFRRTSAQRSSTYDDWRSEDIRRRRRTSIIAGYWQESAGPADKDIEDRNAFHYAVECASGWRRFFVTKKGFIGTGPRDTSAGDGIFIVPGLPVPFIFRTTSQVHHCTRDPLVELIKSEKQTFIQAGSQARDQLQSRSMVCSEVHSNCFSAVGDAYVHALMDGQAQSLERSSTISPMYLL